MNRGSSLLFFILLLLMSSCERDTGGSDLVPCLEKGDTATHTLVVYMMAENSLDYYVSADCREIEEGVASLPSDGRLFLFIDDRGNPRLLQYCRDSSGEVGCSAIPLFDDEVCSSDPNVFATVMERVLSDYPTEELDLVMWSHGDGWLRGTSADIPKHSIGIDNEKNTYNDNGVITIEIEQLASVLEGLPVKVNRLMFDACLMQCIEVAYALRNSANWIIASPAEIPGPGAPYQSVVPLFFDKNGSVEDIIDVYKGYYDGNANGVVLSCVDTRCLQELADSTRGYVNKYFLSSKKREYIDVFSYLAGGFVNSKFAYPCYYDMNAIMKKYLAADEYVAWKSVFDKVVVYQVASPAWWSAIRSSHFMVNMNIFSGVSLYMPQPGSRNEKLNAEFSTTEWYNAVGWDTAGW